MFPANKNSNTKTPISIKLVGRWGNLVKCKISQIKKLMTCKMKSEILHLKLLYFCGFRMWCYCICLAI